MSDDPTGDMDVSTELAYERTALAHENTLMGWVRTATSLFTFGFAVYKFFQLDLRGGSASEHMIGPREFGLTMVVVGLVALLVASWEHRRNMARLRSECPRLPRAIAGVIAPFVGLLGVLALVVMVLRQ